VRCRVNSEVDKLVGRSSNANRNEPVLMHPSTNDGFTEKRLPKTSIGMKVELERKRLPMKEVQMMMLCAKACLRWIF